MKDISFENIFLVYEKSCSDDAGNYIARKYRINYKNLDPDRIVKRLEKLNFDVIGVDHSKKCIVCENKSVHKKPDKRILKTMQAIDKDLKEAHKPKNDD
jgi:hypothetical protein